METMNAIADAEAKHINALAVRVASDRAAATAAARSEIERACEHEASRLRRELGKLEQQSADAYARVEASAEAARRTYVNELLSKVYSGELLELIQRFRLEPGRQVAVEIRKHLDAFNTTAVRELGSPLSPHVLATLFVDTVLVERPAAVNALTDPGFGAASGAVLANVERFSVTNSQAELESTLVALESAIVEVARSPRWDDSSTADPDHIELHAARHTCATHRDLQLTLNDLRAKHEQQRQATSRSECTATAAEAE